jgi:uroporphyrinogen decarboxylase
MRQAGRSLPEYHELRAKAGDFMAMAKNSALAAEVTLQPMRRFAFDAAIVFADIVLLPEALGQKVWFAAGEGPRMGELPALGALEAEIEASTGRLAYVGETVRRVRAALEPHRALIGFAGAPWTVATYMLMGRGGEDARAEARSLAEREPERLDALLAILADASARYLAMQAEAGAQAVQIFESWAEHLSDASFERLVIRPHALLVAKLRELGVSVPVIGFPRAATPAQVERYGELVPVNAVGLTTGAPAALGQRLQERVAIQGALDPKTLHAGGPALTEQVEALLRQWSGGPYIFNLGHGVEPTTPIEHIAAAVAQVTAWRNAA